MLAVSKELRKNFLERFIKELILDKNLPSFKLIIQISISGGNS
jgi:hypothetical protein